MTRNCELRILQLIIGKWNALWAMSNRANVLLSHPMFSPKSTHEESALHTFYFFPRKSFLTDSPRNHCLVISIMPSFVLQVWQTSKRRTEGGHKSTGKLRCCLPIRKRRWYLTFSRDANPPFPRRARVGLHWYFSTPAKPNCHSSPGWGFHIQYIALKGWTHA